jgi:putative transposase
MSRRVYSEINLHLVWHTKDSFAFISPPMKQDLYPLIRRRAEADGAVVHAVGGTANHVHLGISVLPTLLVSDFVGRLKGGSAHDLNAVPQWHKSLQWQEGYGVVSFGTRDLAWVVDYIEAQEQRHRERRHEGRLERIEVELP